MEEKVKSSLQRNFILKLENKCKDFERISLSRPIYDTAKGPFEVSKITLQ